MQKVIIFDSPDGTGKTNIAQALSAKLNIPYFKYPAEHAFWKADLFATALEFDQKFMASYLYQTKSNLVWDRAYPSEWVYSQVFKRQTSFGTLRDIDNIYALLGAWIVVPLRTDYSNSREDDLVTNQQLAYLHDKYNEFCDEWTSCNTLRIYVDTFSNNLNSEITALIDHLSFHDDEKYSIQKSIILRGK